MAKLADAVDFTAAKPVLFGLLREEKGRCSDNPAEAGGSKLQVSAKNYRGVRGELD
jgi:hypothetical protein